MEFTNEIFFNKPLSVGSTVIITYCGQLYREHSKDVSIVFGYGENWAETDSAPMIETESGFEVTLTIKDYNTFNFCFSNSFNIWDNNSGFNYISPIAPKEDEVQKTENQIQKVIETVEENIQEQSDIENNAGTVQEQNSAESNTENAQVNTNPENNSEITLENTVSESTPLNTPVNTNTENNLEITLEQNNSESIIGNAQERDAIEAEFSSLLDSILGEVNTETETIDISNLSGFGLQSIDVIKEEEMINCDEIFAELFQELTYDKKEENIVEAKIEEQTEQTVESKKVVITNYNNYDAKELDNLMDNLLTSIQDGSEIGDYTAPIQTIKAQNLSNEKVNLPALQNDTKEDWIDKIINISYSFSKKVSTAFKKLGSLVKIKAREFGIINNENK